MIMIIIIIVIIIVTIAVIVNNISRPIAIINIIEWWSVTSSKIYFWNFPIFSLFSKRA